MARLLGSPTSTGANNVDASASERAAGEAFALAAVFCFTFWDLYLPALGIRPLDLIGMMLLAVGLCSSYVRRSSLGLGGITSISVCLGGCAAAIAGVFADSSNVRAAIGVCLGTAIFMLFSVWPLSRAGVLRLLNAL